MNNSLRDGGKISLLKLNNYTITTTLSISFPINLYVQNRKVEQSILCQIHLNVYNKFITNSSLITTFSWPLILPDCSERVH